ncbi:hypothetical protein T492DRAFT_1078060 [Pavlovales sp. CCMP2436]|nr:hypothetical protein T492DRAFT_1078060 [Pavlovales sp. CCMP2436]
MRRSLPPLPSATRTGQLDAEVAASAMKRERVPPPWELSKKLAAGGSTVVVASQPPVTARVSAALGAAESSPGSELTPSRKRAPLPSSRITPVGRTPLSPTRSAGVPTPQADRVTASAPNVGRTPLPTPSTPTPQAFRVSTSPPVGGCRSRISAMPPARPLGSASPTVTARVSSALGSAGAAGPTVSSARVSAALGAAGASTAPRCTRVALPPSTRVAPPVAPPVSSPPPSPPLSGKYRGPLNGSSAGARQPRTRVALPLALRVAPPVALPESSPPPSPPPSPPTRVVLPPSTRAAPPDALPQLNLPPSPPRRDQSPRMLRGGAHSPEKLYKGKVIAPSERGRATGAVITPVVRVSESASVSEDPPGPERWPVAAPEPPPAKLKKGRKGKAATYMEENQGALDLATLQQAAGGSALGGKFAVEDQGTAGSGKTLSAKQQVRLYGGWALAIIIYLGFAAAALSYGIRLSPSSATAVVVVWAIASVETLLLIEPIVVALSATLSHIVARLLKQEVGRPADFKVRRNSSETVGSPATAKS